MDVAVVSSQDLVHLGRDELLLVAALRDLGLTAEAVPWRGGEVDWSRVGMAVIRSTWDYMANVGDFLAWVDDVSSHSILCNAADVVHWNADKHYLRDLESKGLPVVPSEFVSRGSAAGLLETMSQRGWSRAVYKPVVACGALHTHLALADSPGGHAKEFARLLEERDMMVQPFMERVASDGEVSLIFIAGRFSHAVVKHPGAGDYRVQEHLGGSLRRCTVDDYTVALAARFIDESASDLLYARVDLVPGLDGDLQLMELELIEPELFLRFEPASVTGLAAAIARRVEE